MEKAITKSRCLGLSLASVLLAPASADVTGVRLAIHGIAPTDSGGTAVAGSVHDPYMTSNDPSHALLQIVNLELPPTTRQVTYTQSATGTGWLPNDLGGISGGPGRRVADASVLIGGSHQHVLTPTRMSGAGSGRGLDPNVSRRIVMLPGGLISWFNRSCPNLNCQICLVDCGNDDCLELGAMVGPFSCCEIGKFAGTSLEVTWNQGLGTPGEQGSFMIIFGPAPLALYGSRTAGW